MKQIAAIQAGETLSEDSNKTRESSIHKNHVSQWAKTTRLSLSQSRVFSSASPLQGQHQLSAVLLFLLGASKEFLGKWGSVSFLFVFVSTEGWVLSLWLGFF